MALHSDIDTLVVRNNIISAAFYGIYKIFNWEKERERKIKKFIEAKVAFVRATILSDIICCTVLLSVHSKKIQKQQVADFAQKMASVTCTWLSARTFVIPIIKDFYFIACASQFGRIKNEKEHKPKYTYRGAQRNPMINSLKKNRVE
ncbi:hypothetical protein D5086_023962 [Populus alba]|uniref:Uncharacterized protein n=1 Tax=Populus alba TaxID=43335 RepID=A0ACC4B4P0_POPAL